MNTQDAEKVARDVLEHPVTVRLLPRWEDFTKETVLDLMAKAIEEDRRRSREAK